MSLLYLPNELLLLIAHSLHPKALNSLLRTNHRLFTLLTPLLHSLSLQGEGGITALQWAASKGHQTLVARLLEAHAYVSIDERDKSNKTALHMAAANGHEAVLGKLLENGADPRLMDWERHDAIHYAVVRPHPSSEAMVRLLLEFGADAAKRGSMSTHHAARNGLEGVVRLLLENGSSIDTRDAHEGTMLFHSLYDATMVGLLLDHGINVNARNLLGETILHVLSRIGAGSRSDSEPVIKVVLERGADFNIKDNMGQTPLHVAAVSGNEFMVRVLLEMGVDYRVLDKLATYPGDKGGLTPLESAVFQSSGWETGWKTVKLLLDVQKDAVITTRRGDGQTLLHLAAARCKYGVAVARLLLEYGADVLATDNSGRTALHIAAGVVDSREMVKLLLEYGADASAQDSVGRTPLHCVAALECEHGSYETARVLLEKNGIDVSIPDINGNTVLHEAAQHASLDVIRLLLEHGGDVSAKNRNGQIPLYRAVMAETRDFSKALRVEEVTSLFLEKGRREDASVQDIYGWTPLHWAAQNFWNGVWRPGTMQSATISGIQHPWKGALRVLLLTKPNISIPAYDGVTVLHVAAKTGYAPAVNLLLEHGADVSSRDGNGRTVLYWASDGYFSGPEVVRVLLEHGADISAQDNEGVTALHLKAKGGCDREVRLMLQSGADVSCRDKKGRTPLHWAGMQQHVVCSDAATILLGGGASVSARDMEGATALHWAADSGCHGVIRDLLGAGADVTAVDNCGSTVVDWAERSEVLSKGGPFKRDSILGILGLYGSNT